MEMTQYITKEEYIEEILSGKNKNEVADSLGIHPTTLNNNLNYYYDLSEINEELKQKRKELYMDYRKKGFSLKTIADKMNLPYGTLYDYRKKWQLTKDKKDDYL